MRKSKKQGISKIEIIFVLFMLVMLLAMILPIVNKKILSTDRNREFRSIVFLVDQALAMYHDDLNVYIPDRPKSASTSPKSANECTPTNRASKLGEYNKTISNYHATNLVRYLDGKIENDKNIPGFDDVSSRPLDCYLDLEQRNIQKDENGIAIIITSSGSSIKYNEFESERRTQAFQKTNSDPRKSVVRFNSFQLYCEGEDSKKEHPENWITNFRDN